MWLGLYETHKGSFFCMTCVSHWLINSARAVGCACVAHVFPWVKGAWPCLALVVGFPKLA